MFGDLDKQQEEIKQQLKEKHIKVDVAEGNITVEMTADQTITNIIIQPDWVEENGVEGVEDMLVVAINEALDRSAAIEKEITTAAVKNMMPPGMEHLFG